MSSTNLDTAGWTTVRLGDVGQWYGGGTPSKFEPRYWTDGTIPWVSPKDMKSLQILDSEDHLSQSAIDETNVRKFPRGTVLLVIRSGILSRTLPIGVAEVSGTMNQDLKGVRPHKGIESMFLAYQLIGREREVLNKCSKHGTTVASIDTERLHDFEIRLAPTPEQRRIVAKIEELFSDLDAGVAALKRVQAKLKRYRASVLKAAVEGRLTEEWRKQHPDVEPADKLLARILAERRAKWEADQLAKFAAAGKQPPKAWKEKYEEPLPPQSPFPFGLPSTWVWAGSLQLCTSIESGSTPPPDEMYAGSGEVPFIKVYNLTFNGALDFTIKPTFIAKETHFGKLNRSRAIPGDVLMNIVGPPLGKVSIVPDLYPEWNTNQAIVSFRAGLGISNRYLATCLLADPVLRWITSQAKATAGQHNISVTMSRALPLPLPPPAEQAEIAAEVDRRLSVVDVIESEVDHALQRAARLRQSILKRAFEGKLVPQDPTDEPAAKTLERTSTATSGHRVPIETCGTPRRETPKRRSRARV